MKAVLIAALVLIARLAGAQTLEPIYLSGQWNSSSGYVFLPGCQSPGLGGVQCYHFPQGAKIHNIFWGSSSKSIANNEILFQLGITPATSGAFENNGGKVLLSAHHNPFTVGYRDREMPFKFPVVIPAGWYLYVYGEGAISGQGVPVEIQAHVYIEPAQATPMQPSLYASVPGGGGTGGGPFGGAAPIGFFDGIDPSTLLAFGWTYDPDTSSESNMVEIYADSTLIGSVAANVPRADVNAAKGIVGAHGWSFHIPAQYRGRTITAYGLDRVTDAPATLLIGSPKVAP